MKNKQCLFAVMSLLVAAPCGVLRAEIKLDKEHAVALGGASLPAARGEVNASEGPGADTAGKVFDGAKHTIWQARMEPGESRWVEYRFADDVCWLLTEYTVTNGYSGSSRDPQNWELLGSADGEEWVTIDTKARQFFAGRQSMKTIRVRPQEAFNRFRLKVAANDNGLVEIAEVGLVVKAHLLPPIRVNAQGERGGMLVVWDAAEKATGYSVRRAPLREGPYVLLASGLTDTRFMDTGPFTDDELSYYTVAPEMGGRSGPVSVPAGAATPVGAPAELRARTSEATAILEWVPSPRAVAYVVRRSLLPEGPYTTIATRITSTAYTDQGLSAGTAYHYVVCGVANGKEGVDSAPVSALFPLVAPSGLAAEPAKDAVILKWNAVALATSYKVLRGTEDGPKEEIAVVAEGTTFKDTGLDFKKVYHYTVLAVNACGPSDEATAVSASPIRPPSWWKRF